MSFQIRISSEAERDIEDIYDYIAKKDSLENANYVLDKLEALIFSLDENPGRGHYPSELERQGVKEYREILFKPYRVIYEVLERKVIIHVCADDRRDLISLLERRLLR